MSKYYRRFGLLFFAKMCKDALKELSRNDPLRMAGATAFFTTFALPPILIILTQILGLIFDPKQISRQLFIKLSGIIGLESMQQIVFTLTNFRKLAQNRWITVAGFIFLLFVATTLFKVIKSSLNQLWKIKVVKKQPFFYRFRTRSASLIVIIVAGFLFVIGLMAEGVQAVMGSYLFKLSPVLALYFNQVMNFLFSIVIVTGWFLILFRFLPDERPHWKVAFAGALLTSLLFNTGKVLLRWLLTYNNLNTIFGASSSLVLLLLFVFYASLILYYGAAFTKVWAAEHHLPIRPLGYAIHYQLAEADDEDRIL